MSRPTTIKIDGVEYVRKDSTNALAPSVNGMPFVLIRTYSAGVHFGYLSKRESTLAGIEVTLVNARRIWYWEGAATLSQIAVEGVKKPDNCRFSMEVPLIELVAIEIIPISEKSNIKGVAVWKQ